jgi:enamine deaminase RidA (YjgF/YER057c/UK114 family)
LARPTLLDAEARVRELGLDLQDFARDGYTGAKYGSVKPHHVVGRVLYLSGHLPELADGTVVHPGMLGRNLTVEEGYAAARQAGLNALSGIRFALGDLNRVAAIIRSLNFVVAAPDFHDIHLVANGVTDLFRDVFGPEVGVGGRATVGVSSLARMHCFETWVTVEARPRPRGSVRPAIRGRTEPSGRGRRGQS